MKRLALIVCLSFLAGWGVFTAQLVAQGEPIETAWIFSRSGRIERRVESGNVQIQTWAKIIRSKTLNPMERATFAEKLIAQEIAYTDASEMNGTEHIPTVTEVLLNGKGNCEAQAIVLASLWQALGFKTSIRSRSDHAWAVIVEIDTLKDFNFLPK